MRISTGTRGATRLSGVDHALRGLRIVHQQHHERARARGGRGERLCAGGVAVVDGQAHALPLRTLSALSSSTTNGTSQLAKRARSELAGDAEADDDDVVLELARVRRPASSMLRTPISRSSGASSRSPAVMWGAARTSSGVRNMRADAGREQRRRGASSTTPLDCASRVSTKPNSPNCASPTPASQATRDGKRIAMRRERGQQALGEQEAERAAPTTRAAAPPRPARRTACRARRRRRSRRRRAAAGCRPSRGGRTRCRPRPCRRGTRRARATGPTSEVSHAVPMHSARMASRNTSRLRLASTQPSTLGTTKRAMATMATTTTGAALPIASADADGRAAAMPPAAPSSGTISTIGHHAQVLEDQRADDEAAVRRVELAALGEGAQHDGRAREREHEAVEDAARRAARPSATATPAATAVVRPTCSAPPSATCRKMSRRRVERELEADREQQQHDADLGQHLDGVHRRRQPQPVGPEQRAGREQARHRRQLEPREDDRDRDGQRGDDRELVEEWQVTHQCAS